MRLKQRRWYARAGDERRRWADGSVVIGCASEGGMRNRTMGRHSTERKRSQPSVRAATSCTQYPTLTPTYNSNATPLQNFMPTIRHEGSNHSDAQETLHRNAKPACHKTQTRNQYFRLHIRRKSRVDDGRCYIPKFQTSG